MRVKKQQLEPYIEQPTGSKLRKQYERLFIVTLFNLQSTIMWNAKLDESQAGNKIARRNINNLRDADDTSLMAESEEELKSFLMRVIEDSEKTGLKLNIQKTKIMASDLITWWQIDGGKWKQWQILFFGLQNHWGQWLHPWN